MEQPKMKIKVQDRFDGGHEFDKQLGLPFYGKVVDVDGMEDPKYKGQIHYMGKAHHVFDHTYRCLANVGGALCVVEVTIIPHDRRST